MSSHSEWSLDVGVTNGGFCIQLPYTEARCRLTRTTSGLVRLTSPRKEAGSGVMDSHFVSFTGTQVSHIILVVQCYKMSESFFLLIISLIKKVLS